MGKKLLIAVLTTVTLCHLVILTLAEQCATPTIDDAAKDAMVSSHNARRSMMVKGMDVVKDNVNSTKGHNMYKMGFGENLFASTLQLDAKTAMEDGARTWWREFKKYGGVRDEDIKFGYTDTIRGHATQMAWGKTTELGCGVAYCEGLFPNFDGVATFVVCNYQPQGNYIGYEVYTKGGQGGCQTSADCDALEESDCEKETGLCTTIGE